MRRLTVRVLVLVSTLAVGIIVTELKTSRVGTQMDREAEEYAVYSGLINDLPRTPGVDFLLVANQTISTMPQDREVNESQFFKNHLPDTIAKETFDDYKASGRHPLHLVNRLTVSRTYILISNQEAKSYFENSASPKLLEKDPNSSGRITMLSRVGFNKKMDEALVYTLGYSERRSACGECMSRWSKLRRRDSCSTISRRSDWSQALTDLQIRTLAGERIVRDRQVESREKARREFKP